MNLKIDRVDVFGVQMPLVFDQQTAGINREGKCTREDRFVQLAQLQCVIALTRYGSFKPELDHRFGCAER